MPLEVRNPAPVPASDTEVGPSANPGTGAQNVHVVGGLDVNLSFAGGGVRDCTSAAKIAGAITGAGWLTVSNLDASATIYFGLAGVTGTSNGFPLAAGQVSVVHYAAVETVYAIGSATVGWKVER